MTDLAKARRNMVDCQIRTFDVHRILQAFGTVPREKVRTGPRPRGPRLYRPGSAQSRKPLHVGADGPRASHRKPWIEPGARVLDARPRLPIRRWRPSGPPWRSRRTGRSVSCRRAARRGGFRRCRGRLGAAGGAVLRPVRPSMRFWLTAPSRRGRTGCCGNWPRAGGSPPIAARRRSAGDALCPRRRSLRRARPVRRGAPVSPPEFSAEPSFVF